jgi:hypothetical protein
MQAHHQMTLKVVITSSSSPSPASHPGANVTRNRCCSGASCGVSS